MRRADRLFQIIQILRRTRRPITADAIAAELETSRRTVYRDVAALIGQRVPIRGEAGTGYVLEGGFDLPPLMLTQEEIEAAVLGAQFVMRRADPALARAAQDLIAKIGDFMDRTIAEAKSCGYVLTPFGRRCWVAGIGDKNPARRGYAERQAINAPLQGGAADVIKRAMVKLPAALDEAGLSARLLLQVHDELLFEASEAEADATAALARRVMQDAASISVPLVVETGIGRSWAEAH